MHIMLLILPIVLCSDSLPLALLCPKIMPIMPQYALKIDTNSHYIKNTCFYIVLKATVPNELLRRENALSEAAGDGCTSIFF